MMHGHVSHATEYGVNGSDHRSGSCSHHFCLGTVQELQEEQPTAVGKVFENKWYVDEFYDSIIVKPLNALSGFANKFIEKSGIDGMVNGVGRLVNYGGRQLRWLQSGQVGSYVLLMVISMVLLFALQFFLKK
jgi:NADH-quinone oxidoreductase subunit L